MRNSGYANLTPSILLLVYRQPGANIIETVDRIEAELPQLQADIPAAIHIKILQDRTTPIRASIDDTRHHGDRDGAGHPGGVRVPAKLADHADPGDFRSGFPGGNLRRAVFVRLHGRQSSLMALTIATGFLVDDAIVMIENITRHIEMGLSPMRAALRGAKEIGPTVISISLSLNAVFIPILLMGGIVGRLFREFAITLSMAIVFSLVITLATTPMMCSRLLRSQARVAARLSLQLDRGFSDRYAQLLRAVARLGAAAPAADAGGHDRHHGASVLSIHRRSQGLFPAAGHRTAQFHDLCDQNTSFPGLDDRVRQVVTSWWAIRPWQSLMAHMGGGGGTRTCSTRPRMFIALKPYEERKATPTR